MLVRLALRNLLRNRRRTALTLLVVAVSGAALLLTRGFIRHSFEGLRGALIRGGLAHLEVFPIPEGQDENATPDRSQPPALHDWENLRRAVEAVPNVRGATGVVVLQGLIGRGERSVPFVGAGLEPDREKRMGFLVRLKAGRLLREAIPAEGDDEVLLGLGLARQLGARVGEIATLTAVTTDGTLNALDVRVAGLVTTGVQDLDERFVRTHVVTGQRLLGSEAVSSLLAMLVDTSHVPVVRAELSRRLAGRSPRLSVLDWESRAPFYGQVRSLYSGIFAFLGSVVFVLVCLSTSNTLLMAVMERVQEIGVLLAIGTSRGQIVSLIVWEAVWLGLIGGFAGGALGSVLAWFINVLRIQMPAPPGAADAIELHILLRPADLLWIVLLMVAILGLSAVVPASRAARMRIAEALVHV
jgi:putative ABC transport system permease protein